MSMTWCHNGTLVCRYTADNAVIECSDSLLVRAYYVRAQVLSNATRTLKGDDLRLGTQQAIKQVLEGVELAKGSPKNAFLLYNGAVLFWQVARPLMRNGSWGTLLEPCSRLLPALASVRGHEAFRARLLALHAHCLGESGKADEAIKQVDAALALLSQADGELRNELIAQKTHLGTLTGKAGKPDPKDPPTLAARVTVQNVMTAQTTGAPAAAAIEAAAKAVDPDPNASPTSVPTLELGLLGWAAAVSGNPVLAARLAARAGTSQDLRPRVWASLITAFLAMHALGNKVDQLTKSCVQAHLEALEELQQCMSSFLRLGDMDGLHAACRCVWNTCLPLLQHNLHHHVKRPFTAAANALASVDSPMTELRARFHLELVYCDINDDLLVPAKQNAALAYQMDYVGKVSDVEHFQYRRPLDRFLEPLLHGLTIRTNIYDVPTDDADLALLNLERAKEARTRAVREDYLNRAMEKLRSLKWVQPPVNAAARAAAGGAEQLHTARQLTTMWATVVKTAWRSKAHQLVHAAAPYVQHFEWTAEVDREMVLLQAECSYIEAEASLVALKEAEEDAVMPIEGGDATHAVNTGIREPPTTLEQAQLLIRSAIVRGMELALSCKQPWLVVNGAVYAWNIFLPYMQDGRYVEVKDALAEVVAKLCELAVEDQDGPLLAELACSLLLACEHAYLLKVLQPEKPQPELDDDGVPIEEEPEYTTWPIYRPGQVGYWKLQEARSRFSKLSDPKAAPLEASAQEHLQRAASAAQSSLAKLGSTPCQKLIELFARMRQLLGMSSDISSVVSDSQRLTAQVVGIVEQVLAPAAQPRPFKELHQQVLKGMEALEKQPVHSIELWTKLARAARCCADYGPALSCAAKALTGLPPNSKLHDIKKPGDAPAGVRNVEWFWAAVAELEAARATLALWQPSAQDVATQLELLEAALGRAVSAAHGAALLQRQDLAEAAACVGWNALVAVASSPALHGWCLRPLEALCSAVNRVGAKHAAVQGDLNALACMCMVAMGRPACALATSGKVLKAMPNDAQLSLWAWRVEAACLGGGDVARELGKLSSCPNALQAAVWHAFAQVAANETDQLTALQRAIQLTSSTPWAAADYVVDYAEWLLVGGGAGSPNASALAQDVLADAMKALLRLDHVLEEADGDASDDEADDATKLESRSAATTQKSAAAKSKASMRSRSTARTGAKSNALGSKRTKATKTAAQTAATEEASATDKTPKTLGVKQLATLVRLCTLRAAACADNAADKLDWLLTAQHFASRLLRTALLASAGQLSALGAPILPRSSSQPALQVPQVPSDWLTFELTPEMYASLDNAALGAPAALLISQDTVTHPEVCLAWLDELVKQLEGLGCDVQCVPLHTLRHVIARQLLGPAAGTAYKLSLAVALQNLGLDAEAQRCVEDLGDITELSLGDRDAMRLEVELRQSVHAAVEAYRESTSAAKRKLTQSASGLPHSKARRTSGRPSLLGLRHRNISLEFGRRSARFDESPFEHGFTVASQPEAQGLARPASAIREAMLSRSEGINAQSSLRLEKLASVLTALPEPGARSLEHCIPSGPPLLPASMRHVLLRRAQYLARRAEFGAATRLLEAALQQGRACGDTDVVARCLLETAKLEALQGRPETGVELVQAAQELGGDLRLWLDLITVYVDCRCGAGQGIHDSLEAVQAGISMLQSVTRFNPAAATEGSALVQQLQLKEARLVLGLMSWAQGNGLSGVKECSRAVDLLRDIRAQTAPLEGAAFVEATLAIVEAVEIHQRLVDPAADPRTHLADLLDLLEPAEKTCRQLLERYDARDVPAHVNLSLRTLHHNVLLKQSAVHLTTALAQREHATADTIAQRPSFPIIEGADTSAVLAYLDGTLASAKAEETADASPSVDHLELAALKAFAVRAASTDGSQQALAADVAAAAVYMAYLDATVSGTTAAAWPTPLPPPASILPAPPAMPNNEHAEVPGVFDDAVGDVETEPNAAEAINTNQHSAEAGEQNAAAEAQSLGKKATTAAEGTDDTQTEDPSKPTHIGDVVDAAEPGIIQAEEPLRELDEEAAARAAHLRSKAEEHLRAACAAAIHRHDWAAAASAAQQLVHVHGTQRPDVTGAALALARSCDATRLMHEILQAAAPRQHLELLLRKQQALLRAGLRAPELDGVFRACCESLAKLGRLPGDKELSESVETALHTLPKHVRVVTIAIDAAQGVMLLTCMQHASAGAGAGGTASSIETVIERAAYNPSELQALRKMCAKWDKQATNAVLHASDRPAMSDTANAEGDADAAHDADPELQAAALAWQDIVDATAKLLAPFDALLQSAAGPIAEDAPDPAAKGKAKGKGAPEAAIRSPTIVLCAADELQALPLEALPSLAEAGAVARDFGLHLLAARACAHGANTEGAASFAVPMGEAASGHTADVADAFQEHVLRPHGATWSGECYAPDTGLAQGHYVQRLQTANAWVYCASDALPQRLALESALSADLSKLQLAVVWDRLFDSDAATRAAVARARHCAEVQRLWEPEGIAAVLLSRGAACSVLRRHAAPADIAAAMLGAVLEGCDAGQQLPAALKAALASSSAAHKSMPWLQHSAVLYGLPHVVVQLGGAGKKGKRK